MIALLLLAAGANAHCTAMSINGAMSDGSNIASQSIDADGVVDYRIVHVPRRTRPEGVQEWNRPIYGDEIGYPRIKDPLRAPGYSVGKDGNNPIIGYIPEVDETYSYWDGYYGLQNEFQLAIGESTCSARFFTVNKLKGGAALLWVGSLTKIAMERCKTARCAVQLMGDLAYKYGYWAESAASGAGEALTVADADEAWMFHILASPCGTKAIWGAQRVPKGHVAAVANAFVIREMDLTDSDNFLASPDAVEIANQHGGEFTEQNLDFTKAFGAGEYSHAFYSQRRVWRIFSLLAPSLELDPNTQYTVSAPHLPFSVKPDEPVELHQLFAIYRDTYQGTPYALTSGVASGAFGNPARYDSGPNEKAQKYGGWERAIGLYRAGYIQLGQARKSENGGVLWVGQSRPEASLFLPILSPRILSQAPGTLGVGTTWEVDNGIWWTIQQLANFMELKFTTFQPEVLAVQKSLEKEGVDFANSIVQTMTATEHHLLAKEANEGYVARAHQAFEKFRLSLIVKYQNGYMLNPETAAVVSPGYSAEWLKTVGYDMFSGATKEQMEAQINTLATAETEGADIMASALALLNNSTDAVTPADIVNELPWADDRPHDVRVRRGVQVEEPNMLRKGRFIPEQAVFE